MDLHTIRDLVQPADTTIALLVLDGLGGLTRRQGRATELEAARTPNLDALADRSICGLQVPVGEGIIPGSGPGHLGLFGYDPLEYQVGRGVLSALGIDFDLQAGDVAARGNFCTVDEEGIVTDRRAGRIETETNRKLCERLRDIDVPGVDLFVEPVKEHRFLFVLRGDELSGEIEDTDPHETGRPVGEPTPTASTEAADRTADAIEAFLDEARERLAGTTPANMVLLRGFAQRPDWPTFPETFGLASACLASYPMYRGVSRLVGMETLANDGTLEGKFERVERHQNAFDFFFIHEKQTDSSGEDGDFDRKVSVIEEADEALPQLLEIEPDVLLVTGDHSTPSTMKQHSWHPVPVLLASDVCRPDPVSQFGEEACLKGGLGPRFSAKHLMPLALAHAGRLTKFGA